MSDVATVGGAASPGPKAPASTSPSPTATGGSPSTKPGSASGSTSNGSLPSSPGAAPAPGASGTADGAAKPAASELTAEAKDLAAKARWEKQARADIEKQKNELKATADALKAKEERITNFEKLLDANDVIAAFELLKPGASARALQQLTDAFLLAEENDKPLTKADVKKILDDSKEGDSKKADDDFNAKKAEAATAFEGALKRTLKAQASAYPDVVTNLAAGEVTYANMFELAMDMGMKTGTMPPFEEVLATAQKILNPPKEEPAATPPKKDDAPAAHTRGLDEVNSTAPPAELTKEQIKAMSPAEYTEHLKRQFGFKS